jgi:DNA invertase Pin-like site-specific DNA recombinase
MDVRAPETKASKNQLVQLREFAAKQGWTISCEYADRESGANRDRIEFQEMFRDAAHRRLDLLLFWSLDRFTREGVLEPSLISTD